MLQELRHGCNVGPAAQVQIERRIIRFIFMSRAIRIKIDRNEAIDGDIVEYEQMMNDLRRININPPRDARMDQPLPLPGEPLNVVGIRGRDDYCAFTENDLYLAEQRGGRLLHHLRVWQYFPNRYHTFQVSSVIGSGAYGNIFRVRHNTARYECVLKVENGIKRMKPSLYNFVNHRIEQVNGEWLSFAMREYVLMKKINTHPENTDPAGGPVVSVGVCGIALQPGGSGNLYTMHIAYTSELMDGTMRAWLNDHKARLSPLNVQNMAVEFFACIIDMMQKIDWLHRRGILHMDAHWDNWMYRLKPPEERRNSILPITIKLIDLGAACEPGPMPPWGQCTDRPPATKTNLHDVSPFAFEFLQFNDEVMLALFALLSAVQPATPQIEEAKRGIHFKRLEWRNWNENPNRYRTQILKAGVVQMYDDLLQTQGVLGMLRFTYNVLVVSPQNRQRLEQMFPGYLGRMF